MTDHPALFQQSTHRVSLLLLAVFVCRWGAALRAADNEAPFPVAVLAPQALKNLTVEQLLDQQVVLVSRAPESWSEAAGNIFVISGRTTTTVGATTLPELLRLAPNLFVAQASSSNWAVNARGFVRANAASNKLLVMIDGRSIYSPLFTNVFWDAANVFLPDLQQIEVISGSAGSTWGSNAVNGVINIETKPAFDTVGGYASVNSGTQKTDVGLRYGWKMGARTAMRVYFKDTQADASLNAAGGDDGADPWKIGGGGFRFDWKGTETAEMTVSGDYYSGRYHNGPAPDSVNKEGNLLTRWARDITADSHLWVRLYYDYTQRDTQHALLEDTRTADLEFQHQINLPDHQQFLWGGSYRTISDATSETMGFVFLPAQLTFDMISIFAQHQFNFAHDAFRLTSGVRLEHNDFSDWEVEPNLRLAWMPARQTLWLGVSQATRIPSRLDRDFFAPESPPYYVIGGPDIKAEKVTAYEAGWRMYPAQAFSLTTTLFYNHYDMLRSVEPPVPYTIANGVAGQSYGVEFFADWNVTPWWWLRFGGFRTEQQTWLRPGGADLQQGLGEDSFPKYEIQLRNTFKLADNVTLWTALRHVDEVPVYAGGVQPPVPAYSELDVSLKWVMRPNLEWSLTGRNLLHSSHVEIGTPSTQRALQRSVQLEARARF